MSNPFDVATRKGLFTFRPGAIGWEVNRVSFLGKSVTMSLADPRDGSLYAAVDEGHFGVHLHRSLDGGVTWEEIATPAYPAGATLPDRMPGEVEFAVRKTAALSYIWSLEAGGTDEPGALWCGTIPGGLFRSDNRGERWGLVESLWERPERDYWFGGGKDDPGIHSIVVDPRDSRRVRIAISCGGVWATEDAGATWSNDNYGLRAEYCPPEMAYSPVSQDAHRLSGCRARPERMWVQHHNGVFRSDDQGKTWEELRAVDPSAFGFAVAAHPHDSETAWLVPAVKDEYRYAVGGALAVAKTTDGGATFTPRRTGLPQRHAYDLVYRHALDVDSTGERLAIGSTTGGVWVSEDSGESWGQVDARLPPVYAVRFRS